MAQFLVSGNKDLAACVTEFSLDLYKQTVSTAGNINVFISPSSVYVVMAMLHAGARNKTLEQMSSSLKLTKLDSSSTLSKMKDFVSTLTKGSKSVSLQAANRLYPNVDKSILDSYISQMKEYFATDVKPMDFRTDAEGSRNAINKWVEEQTKEKIKNLLPSGSISSDTSLVVVNAIYFKGMWATPFKATNTRKEDFHTSKNEQAKVDMMIRQLEDARYAEDGAFNCKILEIMYNGNELGMVILLPNQVDGLKALEKSIDIGSLQKMVHMVRKEDVMVALPKFKLETSVGMKPILSALGMANVFDMAKADFSGIGDQLFVSEVFHKAFVDVNEEGTEAAASTAAVNLLRCMTNARRLEFIADHPFMFMIWDHRVDAPLFMGRFTGPSE